jgi:hypothetical protein
MMERNQKRSHLTVIDGNVYQIRNKKQNQLKQKFNLGNGVVVNPDGTYQKRIRKKRLKEGQCFMDGKLFKTTYQQRKEYSKDMKINKNKKMQKNQQCKMNKGQKRGR